MPTANRTFGIVAEKVYPLSGLFSRNGGVLQRHEAGELGSWNAAVVSICS
jgi:hypothetical protein